MKTLKKKRSPKRERKMVRPQQSLERKAKESWNPRRAKKKAVSAPNRGKELLHKANMSQRSRSKYQTLILLILKMHLVENLSLQPLQQHLQILIENLRLRSHCFLELELLQWMHLVEDLLEEEI